MAANRDGKRFDNPHGFDMGRSRRRSISPWGAPRVRKEVMISIERLLARMNNIRLDEAFHGPEGNRRFEYGPTYILARAQEHAPRV
jgi:cytochrome P450